MAMFNSYFDITRGYIQKLVPVWGCLKMRQSQNNGLSHSSSLNEKGQICLIISQQNESNLVGGLEHVLFFHSVGNVIIPTDEFSYFSEW